MSSKGDSKERELSRRSFIKLLGGSLLAYSGLSSLDKYLEGSERDYALNNPRGGCEKLYENRYNIENLGEIIEKYEREYIKRGSREKKTQNREYERKILNKLSQFYFEKPFVNLLDNNVNDLAMDKVQKSFKKGKIHSLESLRLNPIFGENYKGDNYVGSLKKIDKSNYRDEDLSAISFYANNLIGSEVSNGISVQGIPSFLRILNKTREAMYSYKKILEIDKEFMGGSASSGLATTYSFIEKVGDAVPFENVLTSPLKFFFLYDSSVDKAQKLYEESIESEEDFLMNRVLYAAFFTENLKEEESKKIFENQVEETLRRGENEEVLEKWPLWNRVAVYLAGNMDYLGHEKTKMSYYMRFYEDLPE